MEDVTLKVKICGNTNVDDALCAAEAGADMLGFIFYPKSPRSVDVPTAKAIVSAIRQAMPAGQPAPRMVGVFVNASLATISATLAEANLDWAQLHGDESPDMLRQAFAALQGRVYKALKAGAVAVDDYVLTSTPALLLDANHPNLYGGSGLRADATIAGQVARRCNLLLAGGLTPDNVNEAIRAIRPWGVDVASGVEASPGRKDHAKLRAFVKAAKRVNSG
ncbi:MAG: phosphoribosylanthranilate isomerase [Anaerolineae bacterium]|nr:phosphoribosylanthranilate isomerase [Anaerolineae bacterium]